MSASGILLQPIDLPLGQGGRQGIVGGISFNGRIIIEEDIGLVFHQHIFAVAVLALML